MIVDDGTCSDLQNVFIQLYENATFNLLTSNYLPSVHDSPEIE